MRYTGYTILIFLLPALHSFAADLPVLPMPVHIEKTGGPAVQFSPGLAFHYNGVAVADKDELQEHWDHFTAKLSSPKPENAQSIELGLLGKDKNFDKLVAAQMTQWGDKIGKEGYLLVFNNRQHLLAANTVTGLFYGLQTLKQLIRAHWTQALFIADYPAFEHRAVYDDISRGPISTPAYIKEQIERLSELKINELSFYIEHVVQPVSYPDFAPANGKLTISQIKELSAYARKYHMQLVGSFQSFGHFEKILALPQYKSMGETSTLISPLDPNARKFLASVIGELCDAFSSPYFNVNCDETFDLGKGKSKAYIDSIGPARFYADHIKFLYDVVKQHHKTLMMWGDIALSHEEMLDMLPRDIIYLTWEYGSQPSFDKWIAPFQKRNLSFMVCPGILNSYRLIPDMAMATANIDGFLPEGKEKGALGVVTTVWDDGGAYLFSGDWYGVYKAADKSWNTAASNTSFDARYAITAYGNNNESYVHALNAMMALRKLPLTYNLNDNVWNQKLMPDSGRRLILDNSDVDTALQIIYRAKKYIEAAKPLLHKSDILTLQFSIEQYRLVMEGRRQMPVIASDYKKAMGIAVSNPAKGTALLSSVAASVNVFKNRYVAMQKEFRHAWLRENQPYYLDIAAKPYNTRIKDLQVLYTKLQQASLSIKQRKVLPGIMSLRLNITRDDQYYFQNWLLCGPFGLEDGNNQPAFLYSGDASTQQVPKPGDLISYRLKNFRWQKYASPNGGITELDDFYTAPVSKQTAFAFCNLTSNKAQTITAFASAGNGLQVFCNGIQLSAEQKQGEEEKMLLPLKAGINYILLKIPAGKNSWSFSFRLDPKLQVTNQKYKYFINTEKGNHEAE